MSDTNTATAVVAAESNIVGDWKTYTFHMATEADCSRIVNHVGEHFVPHEPMHRHLTCGTFPPEYEADITAEVKHLLKEGLSFYVTLKNSDEIVAVNMMSDSRNPVHFEPLSEVTRILGRMLGKIKDEINPIFHKNFPCSHYAEISITSVDIKYLGQGIATEMYEKSLKFLRAKGYPAVRTDFSHPGTQRIGDKLGFEVLHKFYLQDQYDEHGMKIFPQARDDEFSVHVIKML